jgi:hypothetical protein
MFSIEKDDNWTVEKNLFTFFGVDLVFETIFMAIAFVPLETFELGELRQTDQHHLYGIVPYKTSGVNEQLSVRFLRVPHMV